MANRFERLFQLPQNQYIEGSPVILVAGVLSKDTDTGSTIAQLKFQSVSEKRIKAVKVSLAAYDVSNAEIQGVNDYQYLDLDVSNGQEFGANKAIVMPNPVSRSFSVSAITVVFIDGTMWEKVTPLTALPTVKALSFGNTELEKQYRIATNSSAQYVPAEDKGLWQCACGVWNCGSSCTHCHISQSKVFAAFNIDLLTDQMNVRLAAEAEKRRIDEEKEAEKKAQQEVAKKAVAKRIKLITAIVVPIVVIILLFTQWILPTFIQPAVAYNNAEKMLSAGQYEDAIDAFQELGDYKDSPARIAEAQEAIQTVQYSEAEQLLALGQYEKAIAILQKLGNYENSESLLIDAKYNLALQYLTHKNDQEALSLLLEVREHSNAEEYISRFDFIIAEERDDDYYTCLYNEKGQLIKTTYDSGNVYTYEHDSSGKLVKETFSNTEKSWNTTTVYSYDSEGNLILEKETGDFSDEDQVLDQTEYKYNNQGQIVWEHSYSKYTDRDYDNYYVYKYDQNGYNVARYRLWCYDISWLGELSFDVYSYDLDGNCISEISYESENWCSLEEFEKIPYMEDAEKQTLFGKCTETSSTTFVYDSLNNLIEKTNIYDGKTYIRTYSYENGLLISTTDGGKPFDQYEYDEFGNLVKHLYSTGSTVTYTYTPIFIGERP